MTLSKLVNKTFMLSADDILCKLLNFAALLSVCYIAARSCVWHGLEKM